MLYKITMITDRDGNAKEGKTVTDRIGRIIKLDETQIHYGEPLLMECVYPGFHKSLITSPVSITMRFDKILFIVTRNSIYMLEEDNSMIEQKGEI